jgi:hypothetical protein
MDSKFNLWVQHFIDQSKGLIPHQKVFYKVTRQRGEGKPVINLVTPTEQAVERAKSSLEELEKDTYDPVTGVVNHSMSKLLKRKTSPKRKKSSKRVAKRVKKVVPRKRKTGKKKTVKKKRVSKSRKSVLKPWLL